MTKKHITFSILIAVLASGVNAGCDDASNSEGTNDPLPECQSDVDTWKCDGNTLSKCISGKWELIQTCEDNTQCNVEKKSCVPNDTHQCTNDTWKCDGNILSKCIEGNWETNQTCQDNTKCDAEQGSCIPNESPKCTNDTWKCDGNILSRCIEGNWETSQTCQDNTNCDAEQGSCVPNDVPECTNDILKCDGNILSKCVAGKWETSKTCEDNAKCNAEKGSCDIECKDTEHLFAGKCEGDDVPHCGTHTNDCTTLSGWKNGTCFGKKCFAEECQTGYHLASFFDSDNEERTICEEDTHDACGSINHQCGTEEICTQGKCKDTCQPGEVVCGGSCINPNTSTKFCGADASCSSFIPCSEYEDCVGGKCVLSSCPKAEESLCTVNDQNLCVDIHGNNPNHCGACGAVCTNRQNAKTSGCSHGQCTYICNNDRVNCGSDTIPICLTMDQLKTDSLHCGNCDTRCESNEFCQDGQCIISSCTGNECLLNNACINQNEHCGTQCLNCNTANHASAGICQSGSCVITGCATGYHLTDKGECEIDSATACPNGKLNGTVNCNTLDNTMMGICEDGICKAKNCFANYHIKDNKCVANTTKTCGSETNDCTREAGWKTGECHDGHCIAVTCQSGFCLDTLTNRCTNAQTQTLCGTNGNACESCRIKQFCSDGTCVAKKCGDNVCQVQTSEYEEDLCVNDETHCGSQCQICGSLPHVLTAKCSTTGTCQITSCQEGYHLYNNFCEEDSITNCGAHGTQCNVANATNACTNGVCTFTCDSNYHAYGSACEVNSTTNCSVHGTQCNVANATNACTDGVCTFTCNSGYHTYGSGCEADSLTNCGAHGTQCNVANAINTICSDGTCQATACGTGYHTYNGACEANSTANCGAHGTQCNVANATNACTNGSCTFTCNSGYHTYGSGCEEDSSTNCGTHGAQCNIANAVNTICSSGTCQATACNTGYHTYNGACEANSTTHCGAHGTQCNVANATNACTNGVCTFTCDSDYHAYGSTCEANSKTNCGAHGIQCNVANATNACTTGACTFTCNTGYHAYGSACEEDSLTNCGAHGTQCNVENATNACTNGVCTFTCDTGYHAYDSACEEDTTEHCGTHTNVCHEGSDCVDGACTMQFCNGTWTNINTDIDNCGACDNICAYGLNCINGRCLGNVNCNGVSHNTASDLDHCGECNHRCSDGTTCIAGECVVGSGLTYCGTQTVVLNTPSHCESCAPCADGQICQNNHCTSGQGPMICNGIVIDSRFDSANCGSCGHRCGAGLVCNDSTCKRITDLSATTTITCNAQTVVPYSNSSNCGGCGIACAIGYWCQAGSCVPQPAVGDMITFGHYEQDNKTSNGKEPIEWRVLYKDSSSRKFLIISDKVLDGKPYNTTKINITWARSTIRSWLNGYDSSYNTEGTSYTSNNFIDTAFTADEKARIVTSNVPAHYNPDYSTSPGVATTDKIFLLSVVEVNNYSVSNTGYPTKYAVNNGVSAYNHIGGQQCTTTTLGINCVSSWWLRSPGSSSSNAAYVHSYGVHYYNVSNDSFGVRPALWLN